MSISSLSNANADSPLLQLPPELLVRVASHLKTPELGDLRRVCKDVEARLFESFAYEFFHKRQFMIEDPSLQALIDISNHSALSKRLTEVIISTMSYSDVDDPQSMTAQKLLQEGYVNRKTLLASGQARDMLVEAFKNLPNLRRVGLRDYDAKGRYRDGEHAMWNSYGHSFADGEMIMPAQNPHHEWALLLHAIGISGAGVSSLEVFLRRPAHLPDAAFNVLTTRMSKTVAPVLAPLRALLLTLGEDYFPAPVASGIQPSVVHLKKFLHHTPHLEHLRLNLDYRSSPLLDWLALTPQGVVGLADYSLPVQLANISTLELGMVRISSGVLLTLLSRFRLKSFALWRVTLDVDDRSAIKPDHRDSAATTFFKKLGKVPSLQGLERVMIGNLKFNCQSDQIHRAWDADFPSASTTPPAIKKGGRKSNGQVNASRAMHQTINFSLGGTASDFEAWAFEMAQRATLKKLRYGVEIESDSSSVSGSEEGSEQGSDLSEDDEDEDDEEEDE